MTVLRQMQGLGVQGLVSLGLAGVPRDVPADDWRSLLELFTLRVGSLSHTDVAPNWQDLYGAYQNFLAGARAAGAIDIREEGIRSVNFLVALIPSVKPTGLDANVLSSLAARTALDLVPMSYEHAERQVRNWQSLPMSDVRDLRFLKNLLSPLKNVSKNGMDLPNDEQLKNWFALLPALP